MAEKRGREGEKEDALKSEEMTVLSLLFYFFSLCFLSLQPVAISFPYAGGGKEIRRRERYAERRNDSKKNARSRFSWFKIKRYVAMEESSSDAVSGTDDDDDDDDFNRRHERRYTCRELTDNVCRII